MKLSSLKIDAAKLEKGDWVADIPGLGDIELKVRGLGNADHRKRQTELVTALPRHKRKDVAEMDSIDVRLLVETVLLDWRNVSDDAGEPVAFSAEAATSILSDPELVAFRQGVIWAATTVADRDAGNLADDLGN